MKERQQKPSRSMPDESSKRIRKPRVHKRKSLSLSQQITFFPHLAKLKSKKLTQPAPKTYTAKSTTPATFTDAIPQPAGHSGQLTGTVLDRFNKPMFVTWDTGSGGNFIERSVLFKLASHPSLIKAKHPPLMVGVGLDETFMTHYVSLPIRILNTENEIVTFECKQVWIADGFLMNRGEAPSKHNVPILLGNEFLRNHRLGIEFGYPESKDYLKYWRGAEHGFWYFPCLSHKDTHGT